MLFPPPRTPELQVFSAAPDAPASRPSVSLVEDVIDVWFAPSTVFARRPQAAAWGPYAVTVILLIALFYASQGALQGVMDTEGARALAEAQRKNPNLTAEQLAQMQSVMATSMQYGALAGLPVIILLVGAGVWLVGRVFGAEVTFKGGVMIASLAYLPKALELLLVTVQGFVFDTSAWTGRHQFSLGVGRLLDPQMSQGFYNLLGRLDIFTIWVTALCVLGLVHAAQLPKARAWVAGTTLWTLGALPALFQIIKGQ